MALSAGTRLGPYEILALIGAGGMGEVYKARDTRLDRIVAVKFSQERFSERFDREARAVAALNHPHICLLYEVGQWEGRGYLVLEFVEGRALDAIIKEGPLPPGDVVEFAIQLASGLEEAHSKGIIHRDIKPSNVIVKPKRQVKLLDFGLAQMKSLPPLAATLAMTAPGMVAGTIQYMSPEQALGQPVDARSDLFSFGAVLYEMATGRAAFRGDTAAALFDGILHKTPAPVSSMNPAMPAALDAVISRAMHKVRELRYQSAADFESDLKRLQREGETGRTSERLTNRRVAMWAFAALASIAVVLAIWFLKRPSPPSEGTGIVKPFTTFPGSELAPAFSPDGKQIAFSWNEKSGPYHIYVKRTDAGAPLRLTGAADSDTNPVWSPDGAYVAFIRYEQPHPVIYSVPCLGGKERRITELEGGTFNEARLAWSPDGKTLVVSDLAPDSTRPILYSHSLETGRRRPLTSLRPPHTGDRDPAFSPDGRRIAFVRSEAFFVEDLFVVAAEGGDPIRLTQDRQTAATPAWTPDGRSILFQSTRAITAGIWRISASGGRPERVPVASDPAALALSPGGDQLAYVQSVTDYNIWRLDLTEGKTLKAEPWISSTRFELTPQYSPDGKHIAFCSNRTGKFEIWMCDSDGTNALQLTSFGRGSTGSSAWSPDGKQIVFDARQFGSADIFTIQVDGGAPRRLTTEASDDVVPGWSHDGRWIYFASDRSGTQQIWRMAADSSASAGQITRRGGWMSQESADGKTLYYAKSEKEPGLWKVPVGGGDEVAVFPEIPVNNRLWHVTAKGVYFAEGTNHSVISFRDFATGRTRRIFAADKPLRGGYGHLALSPDGRFLLYPQIDQEGSDIVLVEHFR